MVTTGWQWSEPSLHLRACVHPTPTVGCDAAQSHQNRSICAGRCLELRSGSVRFRYRCIAPYISLRKRIMHKQYSIDQGRAYVHSLCGETTIISGNDFSSLCNPFGLCLGTICANCGAPDSTKNFKWEDTGEVVSDYRRRVRRESTGQTLINWVLAPLVGALIGASVLATTGSQDVPIIAHALIGGSIGALALAVFIFPPLTSALADPPFYQRQ